MEVRIAELRRKEIITDELPTLGERGSHPVVKTFPKIYRWDDWATSLFNKIVGRDISFRRRLKQCVKCRKKFLTVEMTRNYLSAMIKEIERLSQENEDLAKNFPLKLPKTKNCLVIVRI